MIDLDLAKIILPDDILNKFDLVNISIEKEIINISLDEKNIPPLEYSNYELKSIGFSNSSTVSDFPVRGKSLFLKMRRRKWFIENEKRYIQNNWNLVFEGTKLTKEFGAFLKDGD